MAIWDTISSYFISFSLGFNWQTIGAGVAGLVGLVLVWYMFGQMSLRRGTSGIRQSYRELGLSPVDAEGHTGRGVLRFFTWSIKTGFNAAKWAYKTGRKGTSRLGKYFADETGAVITGETENIEEALQQGGVAAAALELDSLILRPINTDLKEDELKRGIESNLSRLTSRLADISSPDQINEEVTNLIDATGMQMESGYIQLAHDEELELQVRKKSFAEAYAKIKVIAQAEKLSRRIANMLVGNQQRIANFLNKEAKEIERYLKECIRQEGENLKKLFEAYNKAPDKETKAAFYNNIQEAQKSSGIITQNARSLLEALEKIKAMNVRMMQRMEILYKDITEARRAIKQAQDRLKFVEAAEKGIEQQAQKLKSAARSAEQDFKEMQKSSPETVIIRLSGDTAAILGSLIYISERMVTIDQNQLIEFMETLKAGIQSAYRAEESTRVANNYYKELLKSNEVFYNLILETDLSGEIKPIAVQEIQFDKMEEQIASREEDVQQATKRIFISAISRIQDSIGVIGNHVLYLKNLIGLMERNRRYTIDVLSWVMHIISERKSEMGMKFATQAMQYQDSLDRVIKDAGVARRAAAPFVPLANAA